MADKLSVLNRSSELDMLADDDPLAELARIAGIERPAIAVPSRQPVRRDPEFDLEDELLAEFARYDAPRLDPSEIRPAARDAQATPMRIEPAFEPEAAPDPVPEVVAEESFVETEPVAATEAEPEAIDLEDELLRALDPFVAYENEPAAQSAARVSELEPAPAVEIVAEPVMAEPEFEPVAADSGLLDEVEQAGEPVASIDQATDEEADRLLGQWLSQPEPDAESPAEAAAPPADSTAETDSGDEPWDIEKAFARTAADFGAAPLVDPAAGLDAFVTPDEPQAEAAASEADDEAFDIEREFARTVASIQVEPVEPDANEADDALWAALAAPVAAESVATASTTPDVPAEADDWLPESEPAVTEPVPVNMAGDWQVEDETLKAEANAWLDEVEAQARAEVVVAPAQPVAAAQPVWSDAGTVEPVRPAGPYSVDDLLADVERFPIPATQPDWMRPEQSRSVEKLPQLEAAPARHPVAPDDILADLDAGRPAANEPASEPRPYRSLATPTFVAPVAAAPALAQPVAPAPDIRPLDLDAEKDPFDDHDFEIDLGAIELDLQDMEPARTEARPVAPVAAPVAAPVQAPVIDPLVSASAPMLRSLADLDVASPVRDPAPLRPAIQPVAASTGPLASLPFDPTQIAETEDGIEPVMDFDVPDLPIDSERAPQPAHADYDIDIDTEMGRMFAPVGKEPARAAAQPKIAQAEPADDDSPAAADAIAAFERALEEDFRRSMAPDIAGRTEPERRTLTPGLDELVRQEERPNRKPLLLVASVVAIIAAGAAGGYAWYSGKTPLIAGNGEPRIILADKDPVKIQPVDKGGQTVPNQDKAVYDKVAGAANETPKQEQLVSATEEPVDVVQKTLVPDNLPLDDDPVVTSTEDTTDPRLLPDADSQPTAVQATDQAADATQAGVPAVQPRKVRTMVVKPDGTLVAREDPPAAEIAAANADAAAANEPVPERLGTEDAAPAASADQPVEAKPVAEPAASDTANPVEAAPVADKVADEAVAEASQPVTEEVKTPDVAEAKPVETPVDPAVTDQAAALDAAANAEVAAADPAAAQTEGDLPVRVVKTTKVTVNAPIPEGRPVDQPVNVVSTVTDQGNVREVAPAENQEVAKVEQPAAEAQQAALPSGTYVIQIASLPSEADANASYAKLSSKFSNVIGGKGVDIRKAQISGKGTFYRVRIPAGTKADAIKLCERYRAAGGSCLVSK